jgi:hypothetical protein
VRGGARVIVVDVDLSRASPIDTAGDARFRDSLASWTAAASAPPLVFTRALRAQDGSRACVIRPGPFDSALAREGAVWASALFELGRDHLVRKWRLWSDGCLPGGRAAIPSIQLVAAAVLHEGDDGPARVAQWLEAPAEGRPLSLGRLRISAQPDDIAQRILFTIPWRLSRGDVRPVVPWRDGIAAPIFESVPAAAVAAGQADTSAVRGRVVVIGGSFAEARDRYATPLGEMPGAVVLVNAIESLTRYGQLSPAPPWLRLLVLLLLLFGGAVYSARVAQFWGLVGGWAVILVALVPLSLHVLHYGQWLDFALPLFGTLVHNLAEQAKGAVSSGRGPHRVKEEGAHS